MMEWVEGFLKKHKGQQAFDDAWKEIPPYPELSVLKKAYREINSGLVQPIANWAKDGGGRRNRLEVSRRSMENGITEHPRSRRS